MSIYAIIKKIKLLLLIKKKSVIATNKYYIIAGGTVYITKTQMASLLIISYHIINTISKVVNCMHFMIPMTKKPRFSRMGSGKGRIRKIVCKVHLNSILYKFDDIGAAKMLKVYRAVKSRMPIKVYLKEKGNDIGRNAIRSSR